ncbi:hypothetical protein [Agromyces indicus]|uniref:Uncharacterized protein n=1 Tax=Agromyces indicus TaxID=758919 RepID=A0ABU1FJG9_9MICO|nr:hypothetical protein [Agromyces indicus]MDR5691907.1 hypothetical protein [Agromyces indicus]
MTFTRHGRDRAVRAQAGKDRGSASALFVALCDRLGIDPDSGPTLGSIYSALDAKLAKPAARQTPTGRPAPIGTASSDEALYAAAWGTNSPAAWGTNSPAALDADDEALAAKAGWTDTKGA